MLSVINICCTGDNFSISAMYKRLNQQVPTTAISGTIWGGWHYPKHSFILWLASISRLLTQDRLCRMRMLNSNQCVLCADINQRETCKHLFFECQYSSAFWNKAMDWVGFNWKTCSWHHLLTLFSMSLRGTGFKAKLKRMVLSASVYILWQERNLRIFQGRARDSDTLFRALKFSLYSKLLNVKIPIHVKEQIERLA
ncbi:uncharacterized protein LOC109831127 [Asparagus officinalis]|uniref:uncharacterized protein LOC109831127 n=1 Tax=Asparagus officinalis TaxID=4686 RepID=UPI00098E6015|nr:uncharacterized protein LOC109831127 [Asparagus officinalis]